MPVTYSTSEMMEELQERNERFNRKMNLQFNMLNTLTDVVHYIANNLNEGLPPGGILSRPNKPADRYQMPSSPLITGRFYFVVEVYR